MRRVFHRWNFVVDDNNKYIISEGTGIGDDHHSTSPDIQVSSGSDTMSDVYEPTSDIEMTEASDLQEDVGEVSIKS